MNALTAIGTWVCLAFVIVGAIPVAVGLYQYLLVPIHPWRNHYRKAAPYLPRVSVVVPAWNEGAVVGTSIDRLVRLEYPPDRLRVYVVDDASTDNTPDVVLERAARYPGRVFHLRRENGGQGKAHTLNHGISVLLEQDWTEAVLIMDADVIYRPDSLRKMTRHLADPTVGAVTAYISEGSARPRYLTRFIGYEYVAAQTAARRAQNVLGVLACLAGGAQLHSRENLEAIGGRIDTTTLAEDTVSTILTQLNGRRVIFEPYAVVLAEEPEDIGALWKQRLRWGRGERPSHQAVRRAVVPALETPPARRILVRVDLVLGPAVADHHGVVLDRVDRAVPARQRLGCRRLPGDLVPGRLHLPVHHHHDGADRATDRPAKLAGGRGVSRADLAAGDGDGVRTEPVLSHNSRDRRSSADRDR